MTSTAHAQQLAAAADTKKVWVLVGVSDGITSPEVLTILLNSRCELAIAPGHPKFHPNVSIFEGQTMDLCWVGSANLTHSGFTQNVELVHEFESSEVRKWFDGVWESGKSIDQGWIGAYMNNCAVLLPATLATSIPPFPTEPTAFESWASYYRAVLRAHRLITEADPKFAVFSGVNSYLNIIRAAEPIMEKHWELLSEREVAILLGLTHGGLNFGVLGTMAAAGNARKYFNESSKTLKEIKTALDELRAAKVCIVDVPTYGQKAFEQIRRHGISIAVATRLLTLARPDVFVSVNSKSKRRLAQESGLSVSEIEQPSGYKRLIQWILKSQWWNVSRPSGDGLDFETWQYRAALIDVLVREDIDQTGT